MTEVDPFNQPIPERLAADPYLDIYFRFLGHFLHRIWERSGGGRDFFGMTTGITASTTQSQGEQPLSSTRNEVSTVANANDVVTAFSAEESRELWILNNGANVLQVFPASGDDLGAGVDTSVTLQAGAGAMWVAFDDTTWFKVATKPSGYSATNVSTDRAYDADATTVAELADVLGTLISDLG